MSGFKVEFSILNLRATPGIYADALASRPAAGYPGRVFIDTDNPSTGIYRDTGTVWVQIAETATSDVDTLQNVTDNGNTTTNSISVGHANTPVSVVDVRQATAGLNNASNWGLTVNNTPTIASGATFGTNYVNSVYGYQAQTFLQDATIGNSGLNAAGLFVNVLQSTAPGVAGSITVTQASTIRAISGAQTGIYYGGTNVGVTYSHVAALKTFQPINTGSAATVTNNYGIIVADSTPSSGTVTYTNRWGLYQEGASDKNYFAANVLIKSTTDNGNALQVTGNGYISGNVGIGTTSPAVSLEANGIIRSDRVGIASQYVQINGGDAVGPYITAAGASKVLTIQNNSTTTSPIIFDQAVASAYIFRQAGTEKLLLDASGNLGLGVTPSAWQSDVKAIQISNSGANISASNVAYSAGNNVWINNNSYQNSSVQDIYTRTATAGQYWINGNTHIWNIAPSGTAGNAITFTQAMTLDASGNLGIGTTSPAHQLEIKGAAGANTTIQITSNNSNDYSSRIFFADNVSQRGYIAYSNFSNFLAFGTNSSERMRITTGGELLIGTTTDVGNFKLQVSGNAYVSGTIGINTTSPNAAALLQIDSTTQGLLLPRMTTTEINNISTPPNGLLVYNTTIDHFCGYQAGAWVKFSHSPM